jgi:hypothetical protein
MTPTTKAAVIEALERASEALPAIGKVHERIVAALALLRSEPEPTPEPVERDEGLQCIGYIEQYGLLIMDKPTRKATTPVYIRASLPPAPEPVVHAPMHGLELRAHYMRGFLETFTIHVDSAVPEGEAHLVHGGRVIAKLVLS